MVNYYEEFKLDPSLSNEEIQQLLFKEKKKWIARQNASNLEKRQIAEQKILMIEDAVAVFSDGLKRDQYDLKLRKEQKNDTKEQTAQEQTDSPRKEEQSIEQMIETARNIYEIGDTARTIDYCSELIAKGIKDAGVYYYLGHACWENNDLSRAVSVLRQGSGYYPQVSEFYADLALLHLNFLNDSQEARNCIDEALKLEPDNSFYRSVDVLCRFVSGEAAAAETEIRKYIEQNPQDQEYRKNVAEAYISYSDKFLEQCDNGGAYIPTQEAYDNMLYYRKRANEIQPGSRTSEVLKLVTDRGKRTFNKDNVYGLVLLAFVGLCMGGFWMVLILAGTAALAYYSWKPEWMTEKMYLTGQRDTANTILFYLNKLASVLARVYLWIFKMILQIIASF